MGRLPLVVVSRQAGFSLGIFAPCLCCRGQACGSRCGPCAKASFGRALAEGLSAVSFGF